MSPRGIAMVRLAPMASRLVRKGGAEYAQVSTAAIAAMLKHCQLTAAASTSATT